MAINTSTLTRAKSLGVILKEQGDEFSAHWPKKNKRLTGDNAKLLLDDMTALIDIETNYKSFTWKKETENEEHYFVVTVRRLGDFDAPYLASAFAQAKSAWVEAQNEKQEGDEEGDSEEEEEEVKSGSVVHPTYRARYADAGHPTHCGDWLAEILIPRTTNSGGINVEVLDAIMSANGIDMTKYDRTKHGWQGRLRMTGRNMLARRVFLSTVLHLPNEPSLTPPADWLGVQKFKRPKEKKDVDAVSGGGVSLPAVAGDTHGDTVAASAEAAGTSGEDGGEAIGSEVGDIRPAADDEAGGEASSPVSAAFDPKVSRESQVTDRFGVNPPGLPAIEPKGPRKGSKRKMKV